MNNVKGLWGLQYPGQVSNVTVGSAISRVGEQCKEIDHTAGVMHCGMSASKWPSPHVDEDLIHFGI